MGERKGISKKLRFEVFKRDSFTCQYCGRMAPDVVLEIDHINPIVNGGDSDIINLITSCFDCNRGKGKRKLSDSDELKKQQEQLKDLSKKREQLQMLVTWKYELEQLNEDYIDTICTLFTMKTGCNVATHGRSIIDKLIKRYGLDLVYDCTQTSISQYYISGDNQSINKAFDYIGKICANKKKQEKDIFYEDKLYIFGIAKNRFYSFQPWRIFQFMDKEIHTQEDADCMKEIAKNVNSINTFMRAWNGEET